ncbi:MAG: HEAT repeat domain-containing protein [Gaiellales bacterium]
MEIPADPVLVALLERATSEALPGSARENEMFWELVAEAVESVPVDEVLSVGMTFCRADATAMRATGAGLLAELGNLPERGEEVVEALASLLGRELEPDVVRIALHGIATTGLETGLPVLLPPASHPDSAVRLDATHALYSCAGTPAAAVAVEALILLSDDPDDDVRDWATFGLGTQIESTDDRIVPALAARLHDTYLDVREEAALGLARRGDARAFEPVRVLLEADEVSAQTVEAAGYLADERLLRPLVELGEWWEDESDVLRLAIARCDPVARERFDDRVRELVELIQDGLSGASVTTVHSTHDLTTELRVGDEIWWIEDLLGRPDVQDDPPRAAAIVLAELEDRR